MPNSCTHCKEELDFFKSNIFCPYCGDPMYLSQDDEPLTGSFLGWSNLVLFTAPVFGRLAHVDWFFILLFMPVWVAILFALHSGLDWLKHRKEPGRLVLK